jgi:flagellar biosynthetic protein FlhB
MGIMLIPFMLFVILALTSGIMQNGLLFAPKSMEPKFEKISPLKGLKRMFSMKQFVEFLKGLLKIAIVAVIGFLILIPESKRLNLLPSMDVMEVLDEIHTLTVELLTGALLVLFVIAGADLFFQRMQHVKQLRMTKQEVKEEFKNMEGDPQIKARLRQIRADRARQRMMQAVPEADVVVTNPTHFAIALVYDPAAMAAPKVVAKGQDVIAQRIREIANDHDVTIVENPPLARALYASAEIDDYIPEEHFKAVAEVISYVFNLKNKKLGD